MKGKTDANLVSGRWRPYRPQSPIRMAGPRFPRPLLGARGDTKGEKLGLAVLTALSIAGLHSAVCPSYFTMVTFGSQPEARKRAFDGLLISLGLSTAAAVAIWQVFDDFAAGVVAEATALALFGIGVYAINAEPPTTVPPIEKQDVVTQQRPASAVA